MQKTQRYFSHLLVLTLLGFALNCAMQKAPGGGPIDRTPPEVVFTLPAKDSLFIAPDLKQIEIRFSERMTRSSLNGISLSRRLLNLKHAGKVGNGC